MLFHRFGLFGPDGTALHWGATAVAHGVHLLPPPAWTSGRHVVGQPPEETVCYAVPMDDVAEDWLRLRAEGEVPETLRVAGLPPAQIKAQVGPHHLRHVDGQKHPEKALGHVRLGGRFSWAKAAHPQVAQYMDQMRVLDERALILHHSPQGTMLDS